MNSSLTYIVCLDFEVHKVYLFFFLLVYVMWLALWHKEVEFAGFKKNPQILPVLIRIVIICVPVYHRPTWLGWLYCFVLDCSCLLGWFFFIYVFAVFWIKKEVLWALAVSVSNHVNPCLILSSSFTVFPTVCMFVFNLGTKNSHSVFFRC